MAQHSALKLVIIACILINGIYSKKPKALEYKPCSNSNKDVGELLALQVTNSKKAINVAATAVLKENVSNAPVKIALTLFKNAPIVGMVKVPCVNNLGSCTYDFCKLVEKKKVCNKNWVMEEGSCQCPLQKSTYKAKITFPIGNIPSWLLGGDYKGTVKLTQENKIICYNFKFSFN